MSQIKVTTLMNADGSKQATSADVIDGATKTKLFSPFSLAMLAGVDAAALRSSMVAAKSGTNSDITQLSGLTTALSIAQGGTGAATADAARAALGVMGRNRIINGDCQVSQKATVSVTTGVTAYGGADRYRAVNGASAGGAFSQARNTLIHDGTSKLSIRHTVTTPIASRTGGNYWQGLHQLIEGVNCFDFVGKNITASFVFNTNVSGTYSVALRDGSTKSYVSTFAAVANTPVRVEITALVPSDASIPNDNFSGFSLVVGALNTGTYQTSSLNVWQNSVLLAADTATNWGATNGNFIEMTDVQVELGTSATAFERLNFTTQLNNCKRYYTKFDNAFYYVDYAGFANTGYVGRHLLPVNMREIATVGISGASSTNLATSSVSCESVNTIRVNYSNSAVGNVVYAVGTVTLDAEL
jgi:hypothetical protein